MKLENRIALVTGAGSGIGRAIALLFAEHGAVVIVNDVNLDAAKKTIEEMGTASSKAYAARADVSDSAQVKTMFSDIDTRYQGLDILVNNAGIAWESESKRKETNRKAEARLSEMRTGSLQTHWDITQEMSDEEWNRVLSVHLNGTFFCTREALKLMSRNNRGVIINMSSVAALRGMAFAPHYGAAKGGILSFTRSVAQEVASRNIRVNAICPGLITTPMAESLSPFSGQLSRCRLPWVAPETRVRLRRLPCFLRQMTVPISPASGFRRTAEFLWVETRNSSPRRRLIIASVPTCLRDFCKCCEIALS